MDSREINKAIAAHGMWKARLHDAILNGNSEYDPATVSTDTACEFGKWFHAIPVAARSNEFWPKIQELHARFHKEAGRILQLAVSGKTDEAHEQMMDLQGAFVTISSELTNTLYAWKKVAEG